MSTHPLKSAKQYAQDAVADPSPEHIRIAAVSLDAAFMDVVGALGTLATIPSLHDLLQAKAGFYIGDVTGAIDDLRK